MKVKIHIERDGDGYHAYCPQLPGVHVGGDSVEEAARHARDASEAYLLSAVKAGDIIPIGVCEPVEKGFWNEWLNPILHRRRAQTQYVDLEFEAA